jgi:hypothetical protein
VDEFAVPTLEADPERAVTRTQNIESQAWTGAQIGSDDPPGALVALVGNVQGLAHSV